MAAFLLACFIDLHRRGNIYLDLFTGGLLAGGCLLAAYCSISLRVSCTRLLPDRIEDVGLFSRAVVQRADVVGFRIFANTLELSVRSGVGKGIWLTADVLSNPAWIAWLQTLPNLDEAESAQEQERLEADERFGTTPNKRKDAVSRLSLAISALDLCGIPLGGWILFWPRPYEIAIMFGAVVPLIALAIAMRWRGAVSLTREKQTVGLLTLFGLPACALGLRAMLDLHVFDLLPALIATGLVTSLIVALVFFIERRRTDRFGAFFFSAIWVWGVLSFANVLLDKSAPRKVQTTVVARNGKADDDPSLTLRSLSSPHEMFENIKISSKRFASARPNTVVCLAVHEGRFGWRWGYVRDCLPWPAPPPASRKSK